MMNRLMKSRGGIDYGLNEGPPLIQWLVLLPQKIMVVSPPMIVSLRKRSVGLLPKVVESVQLLHW
jgi:hypothetical protein